jgi:hypothetical protein
LNTVPLFYCNFKAVLKGRGFYPKFLINKILDLQMGKV